METTGIIGGAGFIGSYVTRLFLEASHKVKVSTKDSPKQKKYRHLESFPNAQNLSLHQTDVLDIQSVKSFIDGCDILVHCGTPFQLDVKNPAKELFDPTIDGTLNFLVAANNSKTVKKVVMVASVGSLNTNFPMSAEGRSRDYVYTESDEPYFNENSHPYAQAKYFADQVVQQYVRDKTLTGMEIVSVYPVSVMGPALSDREDSTSVGLQYLFKNRIAPNPFVQKLFDSDIELSIVDVRDVAEGIFKAATTGGLHGRKYYLSNESWKVSDIVRMLNQEKVVDEPRFSYSNKDAQHDLSMSFRPASVTFKAYSNMTS
jgi:dihydroflavonol-4-reductase